MVNTRASRGWGREGFGSGRDRGAGRRGGRHDYQWRRQDWVPGDSSGNAGKSKEEEIDNRERWERASKDKDEAEGSRMNDNEGKSRWSHRAEMMEGKEVQKSTPDSESAKFQGEHSSSVIPDGDSGGCSKCGVMNHSTQECTRPNKCDKCGACGHLGEKCRSKKLWEYVAPLCATQVEGQAFFCIPDCPSDVNLKERSTTALITVMSGNVTARQIEAEFKELLGSVAWRWTARSIDENKFTVREVVFPTATHADTKAIPDHDKHDDQPNSKKPRMDGGNPGAHESDGEEDDLLSDDFTVILDKSPEDVSSGSQDMGMLQCSSIQMHKNIMLSNALPKSSPKEVTSLSDNLTQNRFSVEDIIPLSSKSTSKEEMNDILGKLNEKQIIKTTRQSERVQMQMTDKLKNKEPSTAKKRSFEGTNLSEHNSFSILDNEDIADLANNMGILISGNFFEKVDLMKDLEIARHSLINKSSNIDTASVNLETNANTESSCQEQHTSDNLLPERNDSLLIEWANEDSEEEGSVKHRINDSPIWSDLLKVRDIYMKGRKLILGNDKDISVADCAANEWVINFRVNLPSILHGQWYSLAARLNEQRLTASKDKAVWLWTSNGIFSVKSVYDHLTRDDNGASYKHIWRSKIPEKIKIFLWLLENGVILTKDNMVNRKWQGDPTCHFCNQEESISHLMFECCVTRGLYPAEMGEVIKAGATTMLQTAVSIMKRQGRCAVIQQIQGSTVTIQDADAEENEAED
ncbi:hypothetical protein EJB05_09511, partial [Eragrostis curvula]